MRTRQARASHGVELLLGSGSAFGQRQGATTWPSGGHIVAVEISINANSTQLLHGLIDYRDRWLIFLGGQIVPGAANEPGGAADNLNFPWDSAAAAGQNIGYAFGSLYTGKGWDGATSRPTAVGEAYATFFNAETNAILDVRIYADPFTGGLTLQNRTGGVYKGAIAVLAMEQLGVRIAVP